MAKNVEVSRGPLKKKSNTDPIDIEMIHNKILNSHEL